MAVTYTPSGSVNLNVNMNGSVATGTQVFSSYNVPVNAAPIQTSIYSGNTSGSTATGSGTVNRIIMLSGTMSATSTTATAVLSMMTTSATQDIGGNTNVWSHVREVIIFNDGIGATTGFVTTDASVLSWDMSTTVATAWGASTTSGFAPVFVAAAIGTGPRVEIPAGSSVRFAKPFGANGWTVDSSHYNIVLSNQSGVTATYRVVIMGD